MDNKLYSIGQKHISSRRVLKYKKYLHGDIDLLYRRGNINNWFTGRTKIITYSPYSDYKRTLEKSFSIAKNKDILSRRVLNQPIYNKSFRQTVNDSRPATNEAKILFSYISKLSKILAIHKAD